MDDPAQIRKLARLALAMSLQETTLAPALAIVAAAPRSARLVVGLATQGAQLEIIVENHPGMLGAVALRDVPTARALRLSVHHQVAVSVIDDTAGLPAAAIAASGVPDAARATWQVLVDQFCALGAGRIAGLTRRLDIERARIDVRYPARDAQADQILMLGLDQLAEDLGVSEMQRRLLGKMHPSLGKGREIVVGTSCQSQVARELALLYPVTDWDTALRVAEGLVLDSAEAKALPRHLGALAGAIGSDATVGLELLLGPHEPPSVFVWSAVAP